MMLQTMQVFELMGRGYVSESWRSMTELGVAHGEREYCGAVPIRSVEFVQASEEMLHVQDLMKKARRCFFMTEPEKCLHPEDGWRLIRIDRSEAKGVITIYLYFQSDRFGWRKVEYVLGEKKGSKNK